MGEATRALHLLLEYGLAVVIVLGLFWLVFVPRCADCCGYEFTSEMIADEQERPCEILHCVKCGRTM